MYEIILVVNGTFLRRNVEPCLCASVYILCSYMGLDSHDLSHRFLGQFSGKIAIHCFSSRWKITTYLISTSIFINFWSSQVIIARKIWFFNNSAKHSILCDSLFLCLRCLVLKRKKEREKHLILDLLWIHR